MANNFAIPAKFSGCEISSPEICDTCGLKNPTVFSVDKICDVIGFSETRCDEFVFCCFSGGNAKNLVGVYVVENKKKADNHGSQHIRSQLKSGAKILDKYMPNVAFGFLPVLASKERIIRSRLKELRKWTIEMRGKAAHIEIRTAEKRYLSELKLSKIPPR